MFSKRVRATVVAAVFSATAIGVYAFLSPASDAAVVSAPADRPDFADSPAITPWSEYLSRDAVGAYGIEKDLDGNASALFPSDQFRASR